MQTIRIFISSPGDVAEERERAREVISKLQRRYIGRLELIPVLWEEMFLDVEASFQQGIEAVLDSRNGIDIAVFILWSRLGSPLGNRVLRPDGSNYRSGTEREFDLMLSARQSAKERGLGERPSILAYFRDDDTGFKRNLLNQPETQIEEAISQSRLAKKFIEEHFYDGKDGTNKRAFTTFDEPSTFAARLRVHLQSRLDEYLQDNCLPTEGWDIVERGAPYRGLEVFDINHEQIFFGREQEVADVQVSLEQQAKNGQAFVLLVGASGSGKSSLARAGVIPAIRHYDSTVTQCRYAVMTPGEHAENLFEGLAKTLSCQTALPELFHDVQSQTSLEDFTEAISENPKSAINLALLPTIRRIQETENGAIRLILLLDQLEELFTHPAIGPEVIDSFGHAIEVLSASGSVWVLATIRSDFYGELQQHKLWMDLKGTKGQYDVLPLRAAHLQRVITEPAWLAGLRFEEDQKTGERLDQYILDDALEDPEALPLLQYALRELYEHRSHDKILTFASYNKLGGVIGALGKRAEAVWSSLSVDMRERAVPILFRALVTIEGDRQFGAKILTLDKVQDTTVLETFVQARLLVTAANEYGAVSTVRLAHEALIRSWPRLQEWLNDASQFIKARTRLENALNRWREVKESADKHKNADEYLLPEGKPLADAQDLQIHWHSELSSELMNFISLSSTYHENRRQKRVRRYQIATGVFIILAILAIIGGGFAWQQSKIAKGQTKEARVMQARYLAHLSQQRLAEGKIDDAIAYALEAMPGDKKDWPLLNEAIYALNQSLYGIANSILQPIVTFQGHEKPVRGLIASADSRHVLTWSFDGKAILWNKENGTPVFEIQHDAGIAGASISSDDSRILTWSYDKTARLTDFKNGKTLFVLKHKAAVKGTLFIDALSQILTWSEDGTLNQWDSNGVLLKSYRYLMTNETNVDLLTEKGLITVNGAIIDLSKRTIVYADMGCAMDISEDKKYVLFHKEKQIRIFDIESNEVVFEYKCDSKYENMTMSPEGKVIAAYKKNGTTDIFTSDACNNKVTIKQPGTSPYHKDYSKNGEFISFFSAGKGNIWSTKTGDKLFNINHDGYILGVSCSNDNGHVLSWGADKKIKIWDIESNQLVKTFDVDSVPNFGRWSRNSKYVWIATEKGTINLIDMNKSTISTLGHHESAIIGWKFTDQELFTWSKDKTARIWHIGWSDLHGLDYSLTKNAHILSDKMDILLIYFSSGIKVFDTKNNKILLDETIHPVAQKYKDKKKNTKKVAITSDSRLIGWLSESEFYGWDLKNKSKLSQRFEYHDNLNKNTLGSIIGLENSIIVFRENTLFHFYQNNKGKLTFEKLCENIADYHIRNDNIVIGKKNGDVLVYNFKAFFKKTVAKTGVEISSIIISEDGGMAIIVHENNSVEKWDINTSSLLYTYAHKDNKPKTINYYFFKTDTLLSFRRGEQDFFATNLVTGNTIKVDTGKRITQVFKDSSCQRVVILHIEDACIYNTVDFNEIKKISHSSRIAGVKFIESANELLTFDLSGELNVWDMDSGALKFKFKHNSQVIDVLFDSKNNSLIASCKNGTICFWSENGHKLAETNVSPLSVFPIIELTNNNSDLRVDSKIFPIWNNVDKNYDLATSIIKNVRPISVADRCNDLFESDSCEKMRSTLGSTSLHYRMLSDNDHVQTPSMNIELGILHDGSAMIVSDKPLPDLVNFVEYNSFDNLLTIYFDNNKYLLMTYSIPPDMLSPFKVNKNILIYSLFEDHEPIGYRAPLFIR